MTKQKTNDRKSEIAHFLVNFNWLMMDVDFLVFQCDNLARYLKKKASAVIAIFTRHTFCQAKMLLQI